MNMEKSNLQIPGYIDEPIPIEEDTSYNYSNNEHILYHADPDCEHEIVGGDNYSGIKCRKCGGWYCA